MKTFDKILVTGGSGFVGVRLALPGALNAQTVWAPSHGDMDIADEKSVMQYIEKHQPDAIIHSAAISHIDVCEKDPELSYKVNVIGTVNMAKAAQQCGAKLLTFSSDQVYTGCGGDAPLPEDAPLSPTNVYAVHKLEAEEKTFALCPSACALRLTWMFDMPVYKKYTNGNLILSAMNTLMRSQKMTLVNNDHRGMTYVREVVENIPVMLNAPGGAYNYGSETTGSTYDTYCGVFKALGAEHRIDELLIPVSATGEPRNLLMDTKKAQRAGAVFSETLEGVEKMLREYKMK